MADALPTWQIILILGAGGATVMAAIIIAMRQPLWSRAFLQPAVLVRNLAETIGTLGLVTDLGLNPLSSATAILQSAPLAVTLGGCAFLARTGGMAALGD